MNKKDKTRFIVYRLTFIVTDEASLPLPWDVTFSPEQIHFDMGISKYWPLCENRTLVGLISSTFTPSTKDPSVEIMPLIMAKRLEGSSYQTIADIASEGGTAEGPV